MKIWPQWRKGPKRPARRCSFSWLNLIKMRTAKIWGWLQRIVCCNNIALSLSEYFETRKLFRHAYLSSITHFEFTTKHARSFEHNSSFHRRGKTIYKSIAQIIKHWSKVLFSWPKCWKTKFNAFECPRLNSLGSPIPTTNSPWQKMRVRIIVIY